MPRNSMKINTIHIDHLTYVTHENEDKLQKIKDKWFVSKK